MNLEVNAIFQIAGIGIIIAMIHTVLKTNGKGRYGALGDRNRICRCIVHGCSYAGQPAARDQIDISVLNENGHEAGWW